MAVAVGAALGADGIAVGTGVDGTGIVAAGVGRGRDGNEGGSDGGNGGGIAAPLVQLLCPVGFHQEGRGLHPAGALGMSLRSAADVSLPYLPSTVTPSTACAAHTIATLPE